LISFCFYLHQLTFISSCCRKARLILVVWLSECYFLCWCSSYVQ
jgi:hypothetical protein